MGLTSDVRSYIADNLGSSYINRVGWRDMWGFIFQLSGNKKKAFAESHQKSPEYDKWANDVLVRTTVIKTRGGSVHDECNWQENEGNQRRREFCKKYEGYEGVCRCEWSI